VAPYPIPIHGGGACKDEKNVEQVPFFARFLENQQVEEFPQVKTDIHAGRKLPETQKYPSDRDEI
jgi:hypothetical protein